MSLVVSGLGRTGLLAVSLIPTKFSPFLFKSNRAGIGLVEVGEGGAGLPGMGVLGICLLPFQPSFFRRFENSLTGIGLQEIGLSEIGVDGS